MGDACRPRVQVVHEREVRHYNEVGLSAAMGPRSGMASRTGHTRAKIAISLYFAVPARGRAAAALRGANETPAGTRIASACVSFAKKAPGVLFFVRLLKLSSVACQRGRPMRRHRT